jgi:hypothetical protein
MRAVSPHHLFLIPPMGKFANPIGGLLGRAVAVATAFKKKWWCHGSKFIKNIFEGKIKMNVWRVDGL